MKLKDKTKPIQIGCGVNIPKMHGHMTIELTDKAGKKEVIEEDNLITNGIQHYFQNCGFLNYPNIDKNSLVPLLMGGLMCFDDVIGEEVDNEIVTSPDTIHVPAGLTMIANAAQGHTSAEATSEAGTAVGNTAEVINNGWQADGSYLHTYEWAMGQGVGTIACVCLAPRNYAWAGEGNARSETRLSDKTSINSVPGSTTSYSGFPGTVFHHDFVNSTVCAFNIEEVEVEGQTVKKGFLRKYKLPINSLDLRGTPSSPIKISETEVQVDADLTSATLRTFVLDGNLLLWNVKPHGNASKNWGSGAWVQYLWTLTSAGVLTKQTVTNTLGYETYGLQAAYFDGDYCFWIDAVSYTSGSYSYGDINSKVIHVWNRSNNSMFDIANPFGNQTSGGFSGSWTDTYRYGWVYHHGSGDGRIRTTGDYPVIVDAVNREAYATNQNTNNLGVLTETHAHLIRSIGVNLYRDECFLASINNLSAPVIKTSDKAMKIVYRITFEEEENE